MSRKGEVLFEIDPRPLQAALDQAKAQLAQAEAQLGKASLDVERDTLLAEALLLDALLGRKAAMEIDEHLLADSEIGLDWIDFETAVRMELGPTRFPI